MSGPDGILLVDKPAGVTSFDVVGRVRALLRGWPRDPAGSVPGDGGGGRARFRCGHAGTLDPLATGLLVVMTGRASRLSPFLMGLDKTYEATLRFGTETDTLDAEGAVVATAPPPDPRVLPGCLPAFLGEIRQVPPVFSALKRDGRALHRLARAGGDVAEPDPRTVTVTELVITAERLGQDPAEVDLRVSCSSGTYIRSLARDLGRAAGSAAHLGALRRTRVGPFTLAGAVGDVRELDAASLAEALLTPARAVGHLPKLTLTGDEVAAVLHGGQPDPGWLDRLDVRLPVAGKHAGTFAMLDGAGDLVAMGDVGGGGGLPRLAAVLMQEGQRCG
ncbi:MAG: tRNA pseudouridine(55) synthase TruB [Candidatus Krumholzibacteriia bacterium]